MSKPAIIAGRPRPDDGAADREGTVSGLLCDVYGNGSRLHGLAVRPCVGERSPTQGGGKTVTIASPPQQSLWPPYGHPFIKPGEAMFYGGPVKLVAESIRDNRLSNRLSHHCVDIGDHPREVQSGLQAETWTIVASGLRDWSGGSISECKSLTWPLATKLQPAAFNPLPQGAADDAAKILCKLSLVCSGGSTLQRGPPGNSRFVRPSCLYVQVKQWRRSSWARCRDAIGRHCGTTSQIPALQCR